MDVKDFDYELPEELIAQEGIYRDFVSERTASGQWTLQEAGNGIIAHSITSIHHSAGEITPNTGLAAC